MQLLLRHGALAWHSDQRGLTALHWCCALDLPRLCRLLLAVPLYVETMIDQRCRRGWTPLHSGAYSGAASCCEQLVAANAQLALRTPDEWTALHLAALKGHAEVLNILAPHCSTEVMLALDSKGFSALDLTKDSGHAAAVEETHRHLVRAWYKCLSRGPEVDFHDLMEAALLIKAPIMEKVGKDALELCCHIAVGGFHFLALFSTGDLYGWGSNQFGQLGDGTREERHQPVFILKEVATVCAGWYHSLATLQTGETLAWGRNNCGQLGDGTKTDRMRPVTVKPPISLMSLGGKQLNAETLAAGQDHSLAIVRPPGLERTLLFGWGANVAKPVTEEERFSNVSPDLLSPQALLSDVKQVAAGRSHSMALLSSGELLSWGRNSHGQLGDCSDRNKTEPTKVLNYVRQVVAGMDFTLALLESGMVMAFGYNAGGRLGTGSTRHQQVPVPILEGVRSVATGHDHAFAILENGQCLGWGVNQHGCIRVGGDPEIHTPIVIEGFPAGTKEIRAGNSTTLAIGEDGHYSFWGRNFQRQVSCLQDLGLEVGLNWRPSDPVRGEVASAIADPSSYDLKELLASLREGAGSAGEVGPLEEEKVKQQKEAEVLLDPSLVQKYRRPEKHATEEKVATPVVQEEAEEVHRHFQNLAEADEAFNHWMHSAGEKYGRGVHKRVHAKAKTLGRAYALVWQAYRQKLVKEENRSDDIDKDDEALMVFHAKLYKDLGGK
eukprot:g2726.t1